MHAQAITTWSTLVLALVSAIALVVAVVQITENRRVSRVNATLSAMLDGEALEQTFRFFDNGRDLKENRIKCYEFFQANVRGQSSTVSRYFHG